MTAAECVRKCIGIKIEFRCPKDTIRKIDPKPTHFSVLKRLTQMMHMILVRSVIPRVPM